MRTHFRDLKFPIPAAQPPVRCKHPFLKDNCLNSTFPQARGGWGGEGITVIRTGERMSLTILAACEDLTINCRPRRTPQQEQP